MNKLYLSTAVSLNKGKPVTTSLKIAEHFGKNHRDVMRDIRHLVRPTSGLSQRFVVRNFAHNKFQISANILKKRHLHVMKKHYTALATSNKVVGISLLQVSQVPKHLHSLSAFFVPALWWAAREHLRVRRFLRRGKANPVQPATLRLASVGGGFNNLCSQEANHV